MYKTIHDIQVNHVYHLGLLTDYLSLSPTGRNSRGGGGGGREEETWWQIPPRPYFAHTPANLTIISGQTAYLPCRVHMLGDRSVSVLLSG